MITLLKNQAFAETVTDNNCGGNYLQPIQRGDFISLQGFSTAIAGPFGEDFTGWTLGPGWALSDGNTKLYYNASQGDITSATSPALGMQKNRAYILYLQVEVINAGDTTTSEGVLVKINNELVKLPFATLGNGQNTSFEIVAYYVPASITADNIEVTFNNPGIEFKVTGAGIYAYSYPMFEVFDKNDMLLQTIAPALLKFYKDPAEGIVPPIRWEAKLSLDTLANGCYYLKLKDGISNFLNGNFINTSEWTLDSGWGISSGKANFSGIPNNSGITAKLELYNGYNYILQFYKEGPDQLTMTITYFGGGTTTHTFTGTGVQTFSFTASGATGLASVRFNILPNVSAITMSISKVLLQYNDDGIRLNDFALANTHVNTLYLSGTNNDSAFDFDYSTGFTQTLRISAKQDVTSYPEEAETYTYSDNNETLLFGRTQKEHTIFTGDAPVHVHDCIRHLRLHDTFLIDGTPYVRASAYDLNRRKTSALKQAVFIVKEAEGIGSNYRLS